MFWSWCSILQWSKDLAKITVLDNILNERTYEIAVDPKNDGYERRLASMVYRCFWQENGIQSKSKYQWRASLRITQTSG